MSKARSLPTTPPIAALQGATRQTIQAVLADFADRAQRRGVRVAGLIETSGADPRTVALRDILTGAHIPISQNLGSGSVACNLDPGGLATACAAVERAIEAGADLVVLSKFGKQEAARSGLCDAFRAAVSAGLPILTAVAPNLVDPWAEFAGPCSVFLPAEIDAVERWGLAVASGGLALAAE